MTATQETARSSPETAEVTTSDGMYPLRYRPNEFDDWGMIRKADNSMFATVRCPTSWEEDSEARRNGTDPYQGIGLLLMTAANGIAAEAAGNGPSMVDLCAAVAEAEALKAKASADDPDLVDWERLAARHHAEAAERIRNSILLLKQSLLPPGGPES